MKRTHLFAILMIAVAIVLLVLSTKDLTTFSTFEQAVESGEKVKIAGQLSKTDPMVYNPEKDANYFSFYLIDDNQEKRKVVIREKKRHDFERSEQIVVTGLMNGEGDFEASEMLLKCPSKYKEEELALRKQASASS